MNPCDPCAPPPSACEPFWTTADYYMQVPGLDIVFVAKLSALQRVWGPEFTVVAMKAAWLRAASTLAHMGLIRGLTFQFLRLGVPWLVSEAAAFLQVSDATVDAWEAETLPLPLHAYTALAAYVDQKDGRQSYPMGQVCRPPPSYRARVIRVYPDIPQQSHIDPPDPCPPCPCLFGQRIPAVFQGFDRSCLS